MSLNGTKYNDPRITMETRKSNPLGISRMEKYRLQSNPVVQENKSDTKLYLYP
jgi:hypothetical protein